MIILAGASDKLQILNSAAGDLEIHASYADRDSTGTVYTPGRTTPVSVVTANATQVDIVGAPGAGNFRAIKFISINNHSSTVTNTVEVYFTDGTTPIELYRCILAPNEVLAFIDGMGWVTYASNGVQRSSAQTGVLFNASVAAQGPGFATDTYLTGSNIVIPAQRPRVGTKFKCRFSVSKTAAGTGTPTINVRLGAAGSVADASICSLALSAGTGATDVGIFEFVGVWRSVGAGTAAVLQGHFSLLSSTSLTAGFTSTTRNAQTTGGGHDSTVQGHQIGISVNGGTSAAWTIQLVESELSNI